MNIIPSYCSDITCNLKLGFVYMWTNQINGKIYIGSTNGKNPYYKGSGKAFKLAVKKYGIKNFKRTILYIGHNYKQIEQEILLIIDTATSENFYNLMNSSNGQEKDRPLAEETKQKMSKSRRGKISPLRGTNILEETRQKIIATWADKDYHHTDEARQKISESKLGEKNPNYGKNWGKDHSDLNHIRWHEKRNIINPKCKYCK